MANSIAFKGKYNDKGEIKNVTIATLSGVDIDTGAESGGTSFASVWSKASSIAEVVQTCVSATVTGFTISVDGVDDGDYGTPGDVLESAEIFSDDFSDTEVIPTLQIVNQNAAGTSKSFNFKYMADPVDTPYFDEKVQNLASDDAGIGRLTFVSGGQFDTFVRGDMRFTASDTVAKPD